MFLTAVRHEVNNLESSVVEQELELAINLALLFFFMEFHQKGVFLYFCPYSCQIPTKNGVFLCP